MKQATTLSLRKLSGWVLPLALLLAGLLSGCSRQPVVASVDGEAITRDALLAEAQQQRLPLQDRTLQALLDVMIDRQAAEHKAEALDLMDDPEFRRSYRNLVLETLKRRYREEMESQLVITDADIEAEYNNHPEEHTVPAQIRVSLIQFESGQVDGTDPVVQDALAQLKATEEPVARDRLFKSLAVSYSQDRASRYRGGDIGILVQGAQSGWPHAVEATAFALPEVGAISEVVAADGHLYLLKLDKQEPARNLALAEVKDTIRQRLMTARFDQLKALTQRHIREGISIKTYPEVMAAMVEPTNPGGLTPPAGPALN